MKSLVERLPILPPPQKEVHTIASYFFFILIALFIVQAYVSLQKKVPNKVVSIPKNTSTHRF